MGRPKTIFVDPAAVLTAIGREIITAVADIDRQLSELSGDGGSTWTEYGHRSHRSYLLCRRQAAAWPEQDLARWAGRPLTDSERIRHQQAVRQLVADGLLERDGRRVTVTPAGWQAAGMEPPIREPIGAQP
jgi:hypothetical protein